MWAFLDFSFHLCPNFVCKDLFIKIRTRTVVKLLLFLYDFLWINKWFIPKVQHFKGKASLDFETSYLKTLHHWSFHFLVRHWQNDSCYPIRNLVAYQKRSIFCCFSKCLSAIGWTDFCSKHSVELIHHSTKWENPSAL